MWNNLTPLKSSMYCMMHFCHLHSLLITVYYFQLKTTYNSAINTSELMNYTSTVSEMGNSHKVTLMTKCIDSVPVPLPSPLSLSLLRNPYCG